MAYVATIKLSIARNRHKNELAEPNKGKNESAHHVMMAFSVFASSLKPVPLVRADQSPIEDLVDFFRKFFIALKF